MSEQQAGKVAQGEYVVALDTAQTEADIEAIMTGLRAYNVAQAGESGYERWGVYVRDRENVVRGGLLAESGRGWLHVSVLWVDESLRGQGYGTRLMRLAEDEGRKRGCHHAYLDTFDYQARPFYEGLGYEVFGTLDDYPIGHQRFYLRKAL